MYKIPVLFLCNARHSFVHTGRYEMKHFAPLTRIGTFAKRTLCVSLMLGARIFMRNCSQRVVYIQLDVLLPILTSIRFIIEN